MKLSFIVTILFVLVSSVFGTDYFVVDSARIPVENSYDSTTGTYADYINFTWVITNDPSYPTSDSIKLQFDLIALDNTTFISTIDLFKDSLGFLTYSAYVHRIEYDPLDVNHDGKVNFVDLWALMCALFNM